MLNASGLISVTTFNVELTSCILAIYAYHRSAFVWRLPRYAHSNKVYASELAAFKSCGKIFCSDLNETWERFSVHYDEISGVGNLLLYGYVPICVVHVYWPLTKLKSEIANRITIASIFCNEAAISNQRWRVVGDFEGSEGPHNYLSPCQWLTVMIEATLSFFIWLVYSIGTLRASTRVR